MAAVFSAAAVTAPGSPSARLFLLQKHSPSPSFSRLPVRSPAAGSLRLGLSPLRRSPGSLRPRAAISPPPPYSLVFESTRTLASLFSFAVSVSKGFLFFFHRLAERAAAASPEESSPSTTQTLSSASTASSPMSPRPPLAPAPGSVSRAASSPSSPIYSFARSSSPSRLSVKSSLLPPLVPAHGIFPRKFQSMVECAAFYLCQAHSMFCSLPLTARKNLLDCCSRNWKKVLRFLQSVERSAGNEKKIMKEEKLKQEEKYMWAIIYCRWCEREGLL